MLFKRKTKSTEVIEKSHQQLWNDYQAYLNVEKSEKLKEYLTLKEKVESIPFQEKKKEIESLKFKGSPEEKELKEFQKLQKNKKLKRYYELSTSSDLERFNNIKKSGQPEQLNELEMFVKKEYSGALSAFKKQQKANKDEKLVWEQTDSFAKKKAYDELKSSSDILFYKKFIKSRLYKNYLAVSGSSLLTQFEDIKADVETEKFGQRKAYLEDTKRYEKTDDFKALTRYKELDADAEIQLYMKYNDTDDFKFFREWTMCLDEGFSTIDTSRWAYITPMAAKGPGKNFSFKNQLHYANDSDNFDVENGILTLETKKEEVTGLYWDEQFGFIEKKFNYATGVLDSTGLFEREYGYFAIKLKASKVKGVLSSISLVDADEDMCIRIISANGSSMTGGIVSTNHGQKEYDSIPLKFSAKGYMIIQVDWSREKVVWRINEKIMGTITTNIPRTPMGIRIETEVLKDTSNLPHRLDIDWIKCYKKN